MLCRAVHAFEGRSVFEEVVGRHEPADTGRAEEACGGQWAPQFEAVDGAYWVEAEEGLGIFVA